MLTIQHLLSMGGYGVYVWPAYAITLGVFGLNFFLFLQEKKWVKKMILAQLNKSL